MSELSPSPRNGWRVVAALFVMLTLGSGFGFYNLSVYMTALAAERGFAIAELSLAISLFFLTGGFSGLVVARLLERVDVRLIMTGGAVISGIALVLAGLARSESELMAVYVLFGLGNSGLSLVPMTTVVTRWFPGTNRSMALATASTGLSLGGVLITPVCVALIDSNGIQASLKHFGVVYALLLMPLIWGFIRLPASAPGSPNGGADLLPGWSEQQARGSRFFVLFTAAYFLLMGGQVGGIAHLFNRATLLADTDVAARAVQILAVASITARLIGGWLLNLVSTRWWLVGNAAGQAVGLATIALATDASGIWLGALLFGMTIGNLLMLQPLVIVEAFGLRSYARIYAFSNAITTIGLAVGPLMLGVLFEVGGYGAAYGAVAAVSMVAVIVLFAAGALPDSDPNGSEQV